MTLLNGIQNATSKVQANVDGLDREFRAFTGTGPDAESLLRQADAAALRETDSVQIAQSIPQDASRHARRRHFESSIEDFETTSGLTEWSFTPAAVTPDANASDNVNWLTVDAALTRFGSALDTMSDSSTGRALFERAGDSSLNFNFRVMDAGTTMDYSPGWGGGQVDINVNAMAVGSDESITQTLAEEISHASIRGLGAKEELVAKLNASFAAGYVGRETGAFSHAVRSVDDVVADVHGNYNGGEPFGNVSARELRNMLDDLDHHGINYIPPAVQQQLLDRASEF